MKTERPTQMSADQLVAYNLKRARLARGWTQEELAEKLEPYLGTRLSRASLSWAETSAAGGRRRREFTANEILAFSLTFDLPVTWFFVPPHEPNTEPREAIVSGQRVLSTGELLDRVFGESDEVWERVVWLLHDVPDEERIDLQHDAASSVAFLVAAQMRAILVDVEGDTGGLEKLLEGMQRLERFVGELAPHKAGLQRQIALLREVRDRSFAELNAEHQQSYSRLLESTGWTGRGTRPRPDPTAKATRPKSKKGEV